MKRPVVCAAGLPFSVKHPVDDAAVGLIYFFLVEVDVDVGNGVSSVAEGGGDGFLGDVERGGDGGPGVAAPVLAYVGEEWLPLFLSAQSVALHGSYLFECMPQAMQVVSMIGVGVTHPYKVSYSLVTLQ